jgi:hypothetical protein
MPELSPFTLYLIFTAGSLKELIIVTTIVVGAASAAAGIFALVEDEFGVLTYAKAGLMAAAALALVAVLTPSTKTLIAMFGIPALVEGTKAVASSEVGEKSYRAVNKLLDEYLAERK